MEDTELNVDDVNIEFTIFMNVVVPRNPGKYETIFRLVYSEDEIEFGDEVTLKLQSRFHQNKINSQSLDLSVYNLAGLFDSTIESEDSGRLTSENDSNKYYLENLFESIVESEGYNTDELRLSPLFSSVTESEEEMVSADPYAQNIAELFASETESEEKYDINEYELIEDIEETPAIYELYGCDIQELQEKDNVMSNAVCIPDKVDECWTVANYNPTLVEKTTEMHGMNLSLLTDTLYFYLPTRTTQDLIMGQQFALPYEKIAAQQYFVELASAASSCTVEEIEEEEIEEDIKIEESYVPTLFGADLSQFSEPIFSYYPTKTEETQEGCNFVAPAPMEVVDQFVEEETEERIQWVNEFQIAHDYNKEQNEKELNEFL